MAVKAPVSKCPEAGKLTALGSPGALWRSLSERYPFAGLRLATLTKLMVLFALVGGALSASASALTAAPGWEVNARAYPTNLPPGGSGIIAIDVYNVGAASSSGTITVTDTLPPGVTATEAGELINQGGIGHSLWHCAGTTVVTCTNDPVALPTIAPEDSENEQAVEQIGIAVHVEAGASGMPSNQVTIAGGGALTPASASAPVTISSIPAGFGFAGFDGWFTNADGTPDAQAGSHPYEATAVINLNNIVKQGEQSGYPLVAGGEVRNLEVSLPPGLVGDPNATPQCTRQQLDKEACPASTQVGVARIGLGSFEGGHTFIFRFSVFNMVPPPGGPAQFALTILTINTFLDAGVRTGGDYGISVHINNIPQRGIISSNVTLWGVPADPSHDPQRCAGVNEEIKCGLSSSAARKPFLTLPTSCSGPQTSTVRGNTWQDANKNAEASFVSHDSNGLATGLSGCDHLGFGPLISLAPDTSFADTPAGLTVDVRVPQEGLLSTEGVSTSNIKNTTVTLPQGVVINPGQAAGLAACQSSEDGVGTEGPPSCPNSSRVGTDEIETPLLAHALKGNVYVVQSNPPNLKLLVAASGEGVNLKLVGNVHLDEATGQLTTTFTETPALPFTNFKLSFSGGAQAALDTPTTCGTYETTSDFTPWSTPSVADVFPTSSFAIEHGPGGGPCPSSPLPFSPSMIAGATTDQAGAFTNFSLLLQRGDGQQRIEKLQFKEPAGLAGLISSVPLCPEPQAAQGTCPAASHIGHAVVTSGPGPYPLVLPQPGAPELPIYLTGPYKGAPFGLSIVTPVIAGPFNLGTIITRAKIEVDPHTAQITITTDPLPQVVAGVPTDLRSINSIIDRPGFLFNPTNCNPQEFTGTAWGTPPPGAGGPGATAPLSSHFGVGSCRELGFHPKVAVTTAAKSSKANGASLFFNISYPKGALGKESWFNEAKFDLPVQLPARLTTIQKACLASVFETNPAACPPASLIGHAVVHTQVLPVPLSGPVYFVSHGGAKFPDAVLVLQGDGVTVDLTGETFINGKTGITSATFRNTPDVPFENIEVSIPTGPFSEFGANLPAKAKGSFCGQKLVMPTLFKAQNGLEIHQNTAIAVTGCPPSLSITTTKVKGNALLVTLKLSQAGTVKISGKGLKTITKKGLKAGTHTITVPLTATGRAAKRNRTKLKIQASLTAAHQTGTTAATLRA
jgi:hypothetical protein